MQVSEVHDHTSHAIIGGKAAIDFGISDSAEFFNILSSTLYRDQILAVVREVMCNAWDAHIEAGITNKPVRITVNDEHFIVQDFGTGIHDEDMGPIYGVYGNSTKKHDGKQTGGFGLGCKAPFAYTDHFEVTSCHEGIKTVYRLSKSMAQNAGKPAIVPILSAPTEETGLTVKIDLKPGDNLRFGNLVRRIAFNGEMFIQLNSLTQKILSFDPRIKSWLIHSDRLLDSGSQANEITVRYGNVIYPFEPNAELAPLKRMVEVFLADLGKSGGYPHPYKIVFQAPPNSLSVTPSREALSMQEHTTATMKKLLSDFLAEVNQHFSAECAAFAQATVKAAVEKKSYSALLQRAAQLPLFSSTPASPAIARFTDFKLMAEQFMSRNYPSDRAFKKTDWVHRVKLMMNANLVDRGAAQTWLRALEDGDTTWLIRRVIAPLSKRLLADPTMDPRRLYAVDEEFPRNSRSFSRTTPSVGPIPIKNITLSRHGHIHSAPYLRNIIVLAKRKLDIYDRALENSGIFHRDQYGTLPGFLFYHVGLKAQDAADARAFFAKTRMVVVDLIDQVEEQTSKSAPARKAPTRGIAKFSCAMQNRTVCTDYAYERPDQADRIVQPEYVVRAYPKSTDYNFDPLDQKSSVDFAELYGERGGISFNQIQYQNLRDKGVPELSDFLLNEVVDYFVANEPAIERYWANNWERPLSEQRLPLNEAELFKLIFSIPELQTHFQLKAFTPAVTKTDAMYIAFYQRLAHFGRQSIKTNQRFVDLGEALAKIPMDPNGVALLDRIQKCDMVQGLNVSYLGLHLRAGGGSAKLRSDFIQLIKTIL